LVVLVAMCLFGCEKDTKSAKAAIDEFYKNSKGPVKAKLTIGTWSRSLELSSDNLENE
jgi:hypothetical protein